MKKALHYLNHQQMLVKSRDWQEIIELYEYVKMPEMINLIKYISENYSYEIFGTTSMQTLCLAQTKKFSLNENVLRVDFSKDKFEFNYIDQKKNESTGWKKVCKPYESISTFEHILSRLKWILK